MPGKRFRREDWLDFGLRQLAQHGPSAMKVQELCSIAGKTVGSFYHHFEDQAAFFEALADHWKQVNTLDLIKQVENVDDLDIRFTRMETLALSMDQDLEIGMRNFAQKNEIAAAAVQEVDQLRIAFVHALYEKRLDAEADQALLVAQLEYAAFVGVQMIWPKEVIERGQKLSVLFNSMLKALETTYKAQQDETASVPL